MKKFILVFFVIIALLIATITIPAIPASIHSLVDNKFGLTASLLPITDKSATVRRISSKDTVSPVILRTSLGEDLEAVSIQDIISVQFNENIISGSAFNKILLRDASGKDTFCEFSINKSELLIEPLVELIYNETYMLIIPAGAVKDIAGNLLKSDFKLSFTTQDYDDSESIRMLNYDIFINAHVMGELTEEKKLELVQSLHSMGIEVRNLNAEYSKNDVVLYEVASNSIPYVARLLTTETGCSMYQANELISSLPSVVYSEASYNNAIALQVGLEDLGCRAAVFCSDELIDYEIQEPTPTENISFVTYDIYLDSVGYQKTSVIRSIVELLGYSLSEANDLANNAPCYLKRGVLLADARVIEVRLEDAGAEVSLIGVE